VLFILFVCFYYVLADGLAYELALVFLFVLADKLTYGVGFTLDVMMD
jgi:putative flippase GtrA